MTNFTINRIASTIQRKNANDVHPKPIILNVEKKKIEIYSKIKNDELFMTSHILFKKKRILSNIQA